MSLFCRVAKNVGLSQDKNAESIDVQCFRDFDFQNTALVIEGGGNENRRRFVSDWSGT